MQKLIATLPLAGSVLLAVLVSGCGRSSTEGRRQPVEDGSGSKSQAWMQSVAPDPSPADQQTPAPGKPGGASGSKTNVQTAPVLTPVPEGSSFK